MDLLGAEPHQRGAKGRFSIQEKVATFYYTLGLFCITYPICVLLFATVVVFLSWLPLVNLPFPGKAPQIHSDIVNSTSFDGTAPFCYIQQVVLRVAVMPWETDLTLGDAFRAPLYEVFKVLEIVRNYQKEESVMTLGHLCLHIEATKRTGKEQSSILPQYSCLILSPANLWNQDMQEFLQDSSILSTVFNHHSFQKGKTSIAEMLFGMHLVDTGIKRYPIRNRQRVIQYAVTLFLKEYDQQFIEGLRGKLTSAYPLHQNDTRSEHLNPSDTIAIQYPEEINYLELVPLCFAFILIFFYYYFSVRKIEIIKSKLGMAFTATFTIFCNLTMTVGICFFFGLTLNYEGGKGIFPYLALLVGLENVLVLTKSVLSTPLHLDVKIRNAQGVSKEGWSITKNLLLEITVLTFGLFTFVPAIQEFCIFSIVGLITDFFLQMFFFLTILGLDISRTANSIEKTNQSFKNGLYQPYYYERSPVNVTGMRKSRSHPRLSSFPANVIAAQGAQEKKIPKRVRLVNVWARTRFFQRSFMLLMMIWISIMVYRSDLINQYIQNIVLEENFNKTESNVDRYSTVSMVPLVTPSNPIYMNYVTYNPTEVEYQENHTQGLEKLKHAERSPWLRLSARHWSDILKKYNMSLSGQVIVVLPNIKLSHIIRPEQAVLLRNPNEKFDSKFQWQALAVALDPIDFKDEESSRVLSNPDQPFYPTSPMEILLTAILCLISVIVLAYTLVVLYRCICSRNYAEWRASWHEKEKGEDADKEDRVLLEAVPVVVEGHQQQIECLATDGKNIVSTCLGGHLKVWDINTGELIYHIDRKSHFTEPKYQELGLEFDEGLSDYESGSPPSRDESFPRLLNKINTDFSHMTEDTGGALSDSKYDFHKSYRYFYFNHNYDVRLRGQHDIPKDEKRHSYSDGTPKRNGPRDGTAQSGFSDGATKRLSFRDESESSVKSVSFNRELSDGDRVDDHEISPVWCVDYSDGLIVIGCADGRLEFWEGTTGKLKCIFEDETESGITNLKIVGAKIMAVRLCGTMELFQLQTYNQGHTVDWNFTCAYRRMHVRTGSVGSISERDISEETDGTFNDELQCLKVHSLRAHQQPITCLDCEGGRIVTGSQDHTLKVFRLEDGAALYTLHGHCGPITCLFIDRLSPAMSGSGSQDGMLCVWDLMTGACMYSTQAHDGSITSLTYSSSYVISVGTDERLCVWERFQGHLLNTIHMSQMFSNQVLMLAQHLVVTGRSGGLVIWDVRTGECVRTITLGRAPFVFINQLILLRDAVLCDYGKQLRIVRFPLISHKFD